MTLRELQPEHPAFCLLLNFSSSCLRPNKHGKTETAPSWKSTSQYFETCARLSENSCPVSCGLQENMLQNPAGAGGLHPAEPFSHTFPSVDIKFKARLGDLFCQMGWVALGEVVDNQHVVAPRTASPSALERDSTALYSLFIYTVTRRDLNEKRKRWEPRAQCHQNYSGANKD